MPHRAVLALRGDGFGRGWDLGGRHGREGAEGRGLILVLEVGVAVQGEPGRRLGHLRRG